MEFYLAVTVLVGVIVFVAIPIASLFRTDIVSPTYRDAMRNGVKPIVFALVFISSAVVFYWALTVVFGQ